MKIKQSTVIVLTVLLLGLSYFFYVRWRSPEKRSSPTIKVGILHSLTGTMAISENSVVLATLMAIDEINEAGGIFGKKIKPVVVDGKSDWPTFAKEAERLIVEEKVHVVFGCWTSASRKMVKPIFEKHNHLLFYPVQYEGLEQSPNIIYTGAAPNQQIIPGIKWSFDHLGKRFFLVGSDYVFPRSANALIKEVVASLGGTVVGEEYIPLGSKEVESIIKNIISTEPDIIINTINGDSNVPFFTQLRAVGITPENIPTISFSISESELEHLGVDNMIGDYAAWNYFQSINTPENKRFVEKFKKRYGKDLILSDPMEAAYFGVYLWRNAVLNAHSTDAQKVRKALRGRAYDAPEGIVYIDLVNNHTWKNVRIGKIRSDGQFHIVWDSYKPIQPVPYARYKSKQEWDSFLENLYKGWGNKWAKPSE